MGTIFALGFAILALWTTHSAAQAKSELTATQSTLDTANTALAEAISTLKANKLSLPARVQKPAAADEIEWLPWSAELMSRLRKEGRPVYVDLTAVWCATCQTSKALAFTAPGSESVRQRIKEANVAMVKMDFTEDDPVKNTVLARLGRTAIPVNLIYPPDGGVPRIYPNSLMTQSLFLRGLENALAAAPQK